MPKIILNHYCLASIFFKKDSIFRPFAVANHKGRRNLPLSTKPIHADKEFCGIDLGINQSAPKERRRRRAEKRLSKRVFLESPFLLCPLKFFRCFKRQTLRGQTRNGLSKNTLLHNRFSARRLLRCFGAL